MTKSILNYFLAALLLAVIPCAVVYGQSVTTGSTGATGQARAKTITIDFWASEENESLIRQALKAEGYEVKSNPSKPGDPLVVIGRPYLHCDTQENGEVILVLDRVKPTCGPNGELQFEVVWQSRKTTLRGAVKEFIERNNAR